MECTQFYIEIDYTPAAASKMEMSGIVASGITIG